MWTLKEIIPLAFASFAVGFSFCNVIYAFFSPNRKRNRRNNKTPSTDKQREDRNNF